MGFIDKIKGVFVSNKEPLQKEVTIDEFETLVKNLKTNKLENVKNTLAGYKNRIDTHKNKILNAIEKLRVAKLPNPDIPIRAKNLMEGNRDTYIRFTSRLAEGIEVPSTYEELEYFIAKFDNDLKDIMKSTQRSYFVLQEFLANESKDIAIFIKELEKTVNELRDYIRKEGFDLIERLQNEIVTIKNGIKVRVACKVKIEELNKMLFDEQKIKQDEDNAILAIKSSEDFSKYLEFEGEKGDIEEKLRILDNEMFHNFSVLEAALKKYERIVVEPEFVTNYIFHPIDTLMGDNDFKILEILETLSKMCDEGTLELKAEKRLKIMEMTKKLSKELIIDFKTKRQSILEELSKLKQDMGKYDKNKEVEEHLFKQKLAGIKSNELMQRIKEVNAESANVALEDHIKTVQDSIKELDDSIIFIKVEL